METKNKIFVVIGLLILISACQPGAAINQVLSKAESRMEMMDSVANNKELTREMMEAIKRRNIAMNGDSEIHKMMMEDHDAMIKMMKEDPEMMKSLLYDMMEVCKTDTSKMASICKTMMANKPMMQMMAKMKK